MNYRGAGAFVAAVSWLGFCLPAAAQTAPTFEGKTVTMTIGFGAGERPDLYGRILGAGLMKHLPGNPKLLVLNKPGAGGVNALAEWLQQAEPNGLHVTVGGSSQVDKDALMRTGAKYEPASFKYVGGLAAPSQALFATQEAAARLADKSAKPVAVGLVGSTLRTGHYQALWGAAFLGWNIKWVPGYKITAELRQALERGELDAAPFGSTTDIQYLQQLGKVEVVSQSGAVIDGRMTARPVLGKAPIISDLVKGKVTDPVAKSAFDYGENIIQVGMWVALPPGTPEPIVAAYVKAFEAAVNEPQYQTDWSKIDPDSPVAHRAPLETLMREVGKAPPAAVEWIQAELKRQGLGGESR
jgi:tripartite-type tricarboxylate transporter receptor subunit TctC